jgi:hypothetical protein
MRKRQLPFAWAWDSHPFSHPIEPGRFYAKVVRRKDRTDGTTFVCRRDRSTGMTFE